MGGETDLSKLLANLTPRILDDEWVYCCLPQSDVTAELVLQALMTYREIEGMSLLLPETVAKSSNLAYTGVFKGITLDVHSSLEAVGLTAAVATKLANNNISANVIAATYHDHVFVSVKDAGRALELLQEF